VDNRENRPASEGSSLAAPGRECEEKIMAGRKSTKKDARDGRGAASETSASGDEMGRAFTVVVERMESNFKVFGEALTGLTEKVDGLNASVAGLSARVDHLNDRVDALSDRVDRRFVAIDARFDCVDARFEAIDARFDRVDARFEAIDARFDRMDARFDAMDARFDGVDRDLALVKDAITVHDREIRGMRGKR
jgi:archaellum component FlaC